MSSFDVSYSRALSAVGPAPVVTNIRYTPISDRVEVPILDCVVVRRNRKLKTTMSTTVRKRAPEDQAGCGCCPTPIDQSWDMNQQETEFTFYKHEHESDDYD